jgi:fluoride exporter
MRLFLITVFGILGVWSRYYTGLGVSKVVSHPFPAGTFIINISGAFIIGVIYVLGIEKSVLSEDLRVGIMVGFLGGYTTFSSYALESARLFEQGDIWNAAAYLLLSPALGLLAAFGGLLFARTVIGGNL